MVGRGNIIKKPRRRRGADGHHNLKIPRRPKQVAEGATRGTDRIEWRSVRRNGESQIGSGGELHLTSNQNKGREE